MIVRYNVILVILVCGYYEGDCIADEGTGMNDYSVLCDSYNDGCPF